MKKHLKEKYFLAAILLLAAVLRFYSITSLPALNADEAALGYNAYSLIQTGRDEHGNPWPINFQSFNDYKPGLYAYLLLPFIKILGLNIFAVRLPGIIISLLTVYIVFKLTKHFFKSSQIALLSSTILATSPWHLHFSRGAWEVSLATFLISLALYSFILWTRNKNIRHIVFTSIFATLSLYAYQSARVITPLILLGVFVYYRKTLFKNFSQIAKAGIIGIIILTPLVTDFAQPGRLSRAAGVGLLADEGPLWAVNEARGEHANIHTITARVLHNKPLYYTIEFVENYFEHFDYNFLFLDGDLIQRNKVPRTGQMLFLLFPFTTFGVIQALRNGKRWKLIVWWLLVSPVAAAFTFQSPHALRAQNMVVPLSILTALGLLQFYNWTKQTKIVNKFTKLIWVSIMVLLAWNFTLYLREYYIHMPQFYPYSSQYGLQELVEYTQDHGTDKPKIIITDRYDQPYILFLFYLKYPPAQFQKEHTLTPPDMYGFSTVRSFDKYNFYSIKWDEIVDNEHGALVAGTSEEIPELSNIVHKINFPNGDPAFIIVDN